MVYNNEETKYIDMFVLEDINDGGSYRYKGYIYNFSETSAEQYIAEGKAVKITNSQLDRIKTDFKSKVDGMVEEIQEIRANERLTSEAIATDIEEAILAYQAEAESLDESFKEEVDRQIKAAVIKLNETQEDAPNPHEVRTQAGIILASLAVEDDSRTAIINLTDRINNIDRYVARELLASFLNIKAELDQKAGTTAVEMVTQKASIKDIYRLLVDKSYTEVQKKTQTTLDILQATKKYKSDLMGDFTYKRKLITGEFHK